MSSRHLFTFNARSGGAQQPQPDREPTDGAFRSGGQTYETPQRPSVSVPRPSSSGQPNSGTGRGSSGRR
jgi:hypothetical protein